MKVQPYELGGMATSYLVGDPGHPCLIVDFGFDADHRLERIALQSHPYIAGIFLTHGHFDHIAGLNDLEIVPSTRVVIHGADERCLKDARFNGSISFGNPLVIDCELPLAIVEDGDEVFLGARRVKGPDGNDLDLGGMTVEVIHTPFHTAGSVCYFLKEEGILFSGDTLFHLGVGRTDLPGAEPRKMETSLRRLLALPDETKVYPGHGKATTLGEERRYNPYLSGLK